MDDRQITIIVSDPAAATKARKVIKENGASCQVVLTSLDQLVEEAKQQEELGAKVLISFGMFAKIVRQSVDIPVIMVDILPEDLLSGLLQAAEIGKRIVIFGFKKVLKDIFSIRKLLAIELVDMPTVMPGQLPQQFKQLEGVDVVVGGYYQAELAKANGIPIVIVEPRDEEIMKAISMARSYLTQERETAALSGGPVPESSVYASMTMDCFGNIVMMNRLASEYLGVSQLTAVSFSMDDVCPQFTRVVDAISNHQVYLNQIAKIEDRTFLYHVEPMLRGKDVQGVMVTFQDVDTVLGAEASIRRKLVSSANQAQYTLDQILGHSASMTQTVKMALRYAAVDETVLILGETGVGKEMFAQGIHQASRRKEGPFVAINCAALPENILESELFGYVKGAFTGANREGKRGLFEYAHKGTIFLDEIGEISPALQGKLLRVLQEHSIRRIGGETPVPVDIRVIAATNRDLVSMVRSGKFRDDLYFRINVLCLRIPPLRQRRDDIPLLAQHFLSEATTRGGRAYTFDDKALQAMLEYAWPGNVRELQNMVRRVTVVTDSPRIDEEQVRAYVQENRGLYEPESGLDPEGYTLDEALALAGNNKKKAAELMGISRATLYRRMERREP